jgi:hypothetical protein
MTTGGGVGGSRVKTDSRRVLLARVPVEKQVTYLAVGLVLRRAKHEVRVSDEIIWTWSERNRHVGGCARDGDIR